METAAVSAPPVTAARPDAVRRVVALVIDLVIAVLLTLIPIVGGLIATAFWLLRDGLDLPFMDRRSPGKKLCGLRPVRIDGLAMDPGTSFRRNWVFVLGVFLWPLIFIPVLGWLLILLLVAPLLLAQAFLLVLEIVLAVTDDNGRRWGDRIAGTTVIASDE